MTTDSKPMPGVHPPGLSPPGAAAALARELARLGITGIYTAAAGNLAVISVTAELTVWTDGALFWCTVRGQHHTRPAGDAPAAAARLAALIT